MKSDEFAAASCESLLGPMAPSRRREAKVLAFSSASGLPMALMAAFSSSHFLLRSAGRILGYPTMIRDGYKLS